ncbi:MAG: alpha/beta fold hydrolase [bacterium]|nr:alpha/beta fold hydrolase [bacterium]
MCLCAGCVIPINVEVDSPLRTITEEKLGARFSVEEGLEDAIWLEIERVDEPGYVGGYLSTNDHRGALIILLAGASTFSPGGPEENARDFHLELGTVMRERDYRTWSLALRECGTAYGQGDLRDAEEALDWLERNGKTLLGVQRVYVIGYSSGATVATLLNRTRDVDALVSIAGLTEPDQLEANWALYSLLRSLFPLNEGLCQPGSTLDFYGSPGSPLWDELDTVNRVEELRNPELLVHGTQDVIFFVENTIHLQERFEERVAAGAHLAPLEFMILPGANHFGPPFRTDVHDRIFQFLGSFEP